MSCLYRRFVRMGDHEVILYDAQESVNKYQCNTFSCGSAGILIDHFQKCSIKFKKVT